jgi:hypothetical protein
MTRAPELAVYLEQGGKRVFACARDWPGWCRAGRTDDAALEALLVYLPRYAVVAAGAGLALPAYDASGLTVVERVPGSATTDFGAPGSVPALDRGALARKDSDRTVALLRAAWERFDEVVADAPAALRKGPRGGGRDRDAIVEHVVGAEAGYARKIGVRRPVPADDAEVAALREALVATIIHPDPAAAGPKGWPPGYAARRVAWHVLDHAWEIEDRAEPAG